MLKAELKRVASVPPFARTANKLALRGQRVQGMKDELEADKREFAAMMMTPEVQTVVDKYMTSLKQK